MAYRKRLRQRIWRFEGGQWSRKSDYMATEEPLEIQLSAGAQRETVSITMRTPGNDYELAAGFLYSEGIIQAKQDVDHMIYCVDGSPMRQEYNFLRVQLRAPALPELAGLNRYFFTNSACGVCGHTMLEDLARRPLPPLPQGPVVSAETLLGLPTQLRRHQALFDETGGLHAAALFDVDGNLLALREDVGRHNALDKLVGWGLLNQNLPWPDRILMVSGRASYELLQKCRVAGAPIFCAVSAPSSLAVTLAERFDITLVGFLRENRFNVYAGPQRIQELRSTPSAMEEAGGISPAPTDSAA
ncbi:formate dehydrogenase accessory sulfurtransferase FdhD [Litorilinea aerophila]|uniref:Sulfur carrier protein FdhD n=1 Tax=Litorilinea aerophila TaxID=1204385 RepID=A0A540V853_9CHLR|nr:formate dehydrogenase accessory sulfurtransferase FdhD [Litorilinea aerophila]